MPNTGQIGTSPDFRLHRDAVTAVDSLPITDKNQGVNGSGYDEGLANLKVGAGGNAVFEVLYWSDLVGAFISESVPVTFTVVANSGMAVQFPIKGRRFFIAITSNPAGAPASAEVAGFWLDPRND